MCVCVCICIYIYIYIICIYIYIYIYYVYIYIYIYIMCIYIYIYIYIHMYSQGHGERPGDLRGAWRAGRPQLMFIHIHQLFRILYALFELDTVNIYWWCINSCRVGRRREPSAVPPVAQQHAAGVHPAHGEDGNNNDNDNDNDGIQ